MLFVESWFISRKMVTRGILQILRRDRIHWSWCSGYSAGSCWRRSSGLDWNCWRFQKSRNLLQSSQSLRQILRTVAEELELSLWGWSWRQWGQGGQRSWWASLEIYLRMSSLWRRQEMTDYEREQWREGKLSRDTKWNALILTTSASQVDAASSSRESIF